MMCYMFVKRILLIQLLLVFVSQFSRNSNHHIVIDAAIVCSDDSYCEQVVRPGSYCIIEEQPQTTLHEEINSMTPKGVCSNPFAQGCLRTLLPEKLQSSDDNVDNLKRRIEDFHTILNGRICNSDDIDNNNDVGIDNGSNCQTPVFDYPEIRIHNGNWESSIFLAWIYQIILMEILEVPVTIGLGPSGVGPASGVQDNTYDSSFYSPYNTMVYSSQTYPWKALQVANQIGNCNLLRESNTLKESINATTATTVIEPCAHVLPEVFNGQQNEWSDALREGYIDPVEGNGQVSKIGWYVPAYTVSQYDGSLVSFYGIRGEENRHKVSKAFKRPLQWKDYCENISTTNCSRPDTVAKHYPVSETEQSSYFVDSSYAGYFHLGDKNNCTKHPTTCTGVIIAPMCGWSTVVDAQIYWNNLVGLEADGPLEPNGGYSYASMQQIWRAANATKSNVLMWWWKPDALVEEFQNTDFEFQKFGLPEPNEVCADVRVDMSARCSPDINVRRGVREGACDQEAHPLNKAYARSLRELSLQETNLAYRSPGYETIHRIKITDLHVKDLLKRWIAIGNDKYGYDPRITVCSWVVDNLDLLLVGIPDGYPRKLLDTSSYRGYKFASIVVASCANLIVWISLGATYHYRKTQVMVFAQVYYVQLVLFGYGLISIAAIVVVLRPTDLTCAITKWLVALGYTFELVPLLVKISVINKIMQSAKKMRRVKISQKAMGRIVLGVVLVVMIYLILWTSVDPLSVVEDRALTTTITTTSDGGELSELTIDTTPFVLSNVKCYCKHYAIWSFVVVGVQGILLLMASVLAFQSRHVQQEFNESRTLGALAYSHFIFLLLRMAVIALDDFYDISNSSNGGRGIPATIIATIFSMLYSFDTLAAVCIYILPKVKNARKESLNSSSTFSANFDVHDTQQQPNRTTSRRLSTRSGSVAEIERNAAKERENFQRSSRLSFHTNSRSSLDYSIDDSIIDNRDDSGVISRRIEAIHEQNEEDINDSNCYSSVMVDDYDDDDDVTAGNEEMEDNKATKELIVNNNPKEGMGDDCKDDNLIDGEK